VILSQPHTLLRMNLSSQGLWTAPTKFAIHVEGLELGFINGSEQMDDLGASLQQAACDRR